MIRKEWFCPQPRLILCGGGHVSREVAAFAHRLDFSVTVIDDRPEAVTWERFPTAERRICDSYSHLKDYLEEHKDTIKDTNPPYGFRINCELFEKGEEMTDKRRFFRSGRRVCARG